MKKTDFFERLNAALNGNDETIVSFLAQLVTEAGDLATHRDGSTEHFKWNSDSTLFVSTISQNKIFVDFHRTESSYLGVIPVTRFTCTIVDEDVTIELE